MRGREDHEKAIIDSDVQERSFKLIGYGSGGAWRSENVQF